MSVFILAMAASSVDDAFGGSKESYVAFIFSTYALGNRVAHMFQSMDEPCDVSNLSK